MHNQEIERKLLFRKQNYYEGGAKHLKQLAYRLRKQCTENTVYKIKDPITKEVITWIKLGTALKDIMKNYIRNPVQTMIKKMEELLMSLHRPSFTEEENKGLIKEITKEELQSVIGKLKTSKAPGPESFTAGW